MKLRFLRHLWWILPSLGYVASGLYLVRGNELALVRWCGKAQPKMVAAGLHFGWPWPFARVERINLNQMRTFGFGVSGGDEVEDTDFLRPVAASREGEYLTGDKNILHLLVSVQYRVVDPHAFLLRQEAPQRHLKYLTQTRIAQAVGASGVDYVHPLGLNELRQIVTIAVRDSVERLQLGILVEDVAISEVRPPLQVKHAFLDVANARSEKERLISEAQSAAEHALLQAQSAGQQHLDQATTQSFREHSVARNEAQRFLALLQQIEESAQAGGQTMLAAKRATQQRMYLTVLEELLPRLRDQIVIGEGQPIDLLLPRISERTENASPTTGNP